MSTNELPPDDDADRPDELSADDGTETEKWDMSEQLGRGAGDGPVLRDAADPDSETFGELSDEDETDRFTVSGSVDDFIVDGEPVPELPAHELESVQAAGPLELWPTRREREAEIMGYPQAVDYEAAEQGRQNAEAQTVTQLSGVYELAGFLHSSSEGQRAAAVSSSETEDGARTWFTPTGRVSVHQHRDFDYEDQSVRSRLPDKNDDQSAFGVMEVQTQELVPYNDDGDIVEVTVRVTYETVENGSVYWKRMQTGFTKPEDGAPCPEGEEALLGTVDPEALPPGVNLSQAIENKLLSYVWTNTREVFEGVAREVDEDDEDEAAVEAEDTAADALASEIETEQAEAERNTASVRDRAIREAGQHLYDYEHSPSKGLENFTVSRAYADLVALGSSFGNAELIAGYTERLEQVEDVPATYLVRAYFAGSDAGDPEMLTKVDTLLTGEMIDRMKNEGDPYGLLGMAGLQQAVVEYESRGISPDTLIADKTLSAEERWAQTLYHQSRTRGADPDAAGRLQHTIQQLAYNEGGRFTPAFIAEMAPSILHMCSDPDDRARLVDQFTDAVDHLQPSGKTFRSLRNVGNQVLQDSELTGKGLIYPLNTRIITQSEQVTGDITVFNGRREWDVTFIAHTDLPAAELIEKIQESTDTTIGQSTNEVFRAAMATAHSSLLQTGAEAYARQGKFAQSRELIAAMGVGGQASAYEACLHSAKSPIDVQRLKPPVDTETQIYDPDIAMLFEANEARISNDVGAMTTAVYRLADSIANAGDDDEESSLPDPARCQDQAVNLLSSMGSMHPGSELPAARALLQGMRQSATFGSSLDMMAITFRSLTEYGSSEDHELVYQTIRDFDATDAKKAEEYARLALRLTQAD